MFIFDAAKENIPFQGTGLVMSRKLMQSNPQLAENMVRALTEAVAVHSHSVKQENRRGNIAEVFEVE